MRSGIRLTMQLAVLSYQQDNQYFGVPQDVAVERISQMPADKLAKAYRALPWEYNHRQQANVIRATAGIIPPVLKDDLEE